MRRRRTLCLALAASMLVTMLPQIAIPRAAATEEKDAFGITLKDDESFDASDLKDNPYGTDEWFSFITKAELVESKTKQDRGRNQYVYRYGDQDSSARTQEASFSQTKDYSLIATAAFDYDKNGRKELIANLAYNRSEKELYLYTTDSNGQKGDAVKLESVDFLKKVWSYHATSHMAIAAGDFDGDGKDTVVVYEPNSLKLVEYDWSGSSWASKGDVSHIGNTLGDKGQERLTWVMANDNDGAGDELRATPSVQLAVDDTDKDGKDELVVASSWNDLEQDNYKYDAGDGKGEQTHNADWQCSWVSVFDFDKDSNDGNKYKWSKTFNQVLQKSGDETAKGRLRFAGVTVGNVEQTTGDVDAPEIICVGYLDESSGDGCNIDEDKFGIYTFRYSKDSQGNGKYEKILNGQEVDASGFSDGGCYDSDEIQDPVAVVAFASRGNTYADDLFIEGDVYRYSGVGSSGEFKFQWRASYFNDDDDGIDRFIISNGGVSQAIAANFTGDVNGREEVVFSTVQKYKHGSGHFWKTRMYRNTGSADKDGSWNDEWGQTDYGWSMYHDGETQVSLTAADVGKNDGTQAKIKSKTREYSKPQVMAILEAPPYFSEIAEGDIGNGTTAYGKAKSTGGSETNSTSVSLGVMVGFEYEDPITNSGGGFEATVSNEWTWETTESVEQEVSVTYSNDSGDNAVVVYRTPVVVYTYEILDYATGATFEDNEVKIGIQGQPVHTMISVDAYNAAADQFGLTHITNDMIGKAGNPSSYHQGLPSSDHSWTSETTGSYAGLGTIEQTVTNTNSTEKSSSYNFSTEVSAFGSVSGMKAGLSVGGGFGSGTTTMNSASVSKTGAVSARPDVDNAENYDFTWQFATWTQELNGNNVPVLGYLVTGITAPPSPAENLALSENTTNSMKLTWEAGDRPANEYRVYRYNPDNTRRPYTLLGTVVGGSVEDNTYSYQLEGLASGTTYQYVVAGYSPSNGESVYSEIVTGTTLEDDGATLVLNKLSDQSAQLGDEAVFEASVADYGDYYRTSFQWQEKLSGNNWKDVEGGNSSRLSVTANSERIGAQYRCIVYGENRAADSVPYYTNAAKLTIGQNVYSDLTIANYTGGSGTQAEPYTGTASYTALTPETKQETVTSVQPSVTVSVANETKEALVYKVGSQLVATVVDNNDKTRYFAVTKTGEAPQAVYTAGNELTYSVATSFKKGTDDYTTWPSDTAQNGILQPLSVEIGGKTYYRYVGVKGTFAGYTLPKYNTNGDLQNKPTEQDVEAKLTAVTGLVGQYISADGITFYAYTEGMSSLSAAATLPDGATAMELYQSETNGVTLVGHLDQDLDYTAASGDTKASWDVISNYRLYEIEKKEETSGEGESAVTTTTYTPTQITYTTTETLSGNGFTDVTELTLEPETTSKIRDVITYKATSVTGKQLTLSVMARKGATDGVAAANADYTIRLVNQSTGAVTTLTGKTGTDGKATKTWRASSSGLYVIQVVTGNHVTQNQYYLASGSADLYSLTAEDDNSTVVTTATYGDTVSLKTSKSTTAGSTSEYTGNLTYSYRFNGGEETTISTPKAFKLPDAGTFTLYVKENNKTLASTVLSVEKRVITIKPTWENEVTGEAPAKLSDITVQAENLASGDKLDDIVQIVCSLYKDGVLDENQSGAFTVSLDYVKDSGAYTSAVQSFLSHYQVTMKTAQILRALDTYPVYYEAGENGTIEGRWGDSGNVFTTGALIEKSRSLRFQATPGSGYVVDNWTVNGAKIDTNSAGYKLSDDKTILTASSFSDSMLDANKQMHVTVSFKSDKHTISYSVNGGQGTLEAQTADKNPVANGAAVAEGSDITFMATPAENYSIEKWIVDGKDYTWPDSEALYRAQTLTLENVGDSHMVSVFFTDHATIQIGTSLIDEDGKVSSAANITVTDATDQDKVLDLGAIESGSSLTFTATPDSSNTGVKEWQTSADNGRTWKTVTGSGGQKTYTLYNLTESTQVRAVLTTAQSYSLTFKVQQNGADVTDTSIAKLTAEINKRALTSSTNQPAYSQADFKLELNDNYYVIGWSGISSDKTTTAVLDSLTANTEVVVNIQEKPTVSWTNPTGGIITVKDQDGKDVAVNSHVEPNSALTVTATPTADYVVDKINGKAENAKWAEGAISASMTVGATGDHPATAIFMEKPTITWDDPNGGRITVQDENGVTVSKGSHVRPTSTVTVTATPNNGFVAQTINNENVNPNKSNGAKSTKMTMTETGANQARASFLLKPVVTWDFAANGSISVTGTKDGRSYTYQTSESGNYFDFGSKVTITAAPDTNYYVASIAANGTSKFADSKDTYTGGKETAEATADLQANMHITAAFAEKPVITFTGDANITVAAKQGDKALTTGIHVEKYSDDITFTATPAKGYETDAWKVNNSVITGTPVNADDNDQITYTQAGTINGNIIAAVTAKAIPRFDLTMNVESIDAEGGHGTVSAQITRKNLSAYNEELTASGKFYRGSNLTITAVPDEGYRVQSWTVDGKTTETSALTQTLTNCQKPVSVTVRFVKLGAGITFTKNTTGGGVTEAKTNSGVDAMDHAESGVTLAKGASITFTAEPQTGYEVKDWLVNGTSQNTNSETFTYTSDGQGGAHITPVFQTIVYEINFGAAPSDKGGVTAVGLTNGQARGGESLTFIAAPNPGNKVVRWTINNEEQSATGNTLTWIVPIGVPGGTIYDILTVMTEDSFTLTYDQPANGTLTAAANGKTIASDADDVLGGTKVTFTAAPDEHYEVDHWTVDGQTQTGGNTLDVTIIGNTTVSVSYKLKQYSVTLTQGANGTATATQTGSVDAKTQVTFTATPATGYHLSHWSVNGKTQQTETNTLTLTITGNTEVQPVFEIDALTVNYGLASGSKQARIQATVNGVALTSGSTVSYGSDVVFTVTPSGTDMVDSWSVDGTVVNRMTDTEDAVTTYEVKNVTSSKDIQIKVIDRPNYTVTVADGITNGSVTIVDGENGKITVPRNGSVTLNAVPVDVYHMIGSWIVNGTTLTDEKGTELKLDGIKKDTTVSATFREAVSYNVTLKVDKTAVASENVSVTVMDATKNQAIQPGETVATAASVLGGSKLVFTADDAAGKTMVGSWKINGQVQDNLSKEMVINGLTGAANVEVTFVPEVLYSIPDNGSNYAVTVDQRVPTDYGTEQQIRKNGSATFTVKPESGYYMTTLKVNGTECLTTAGTDTAENKLTVVDNQDGSYTITVANVTKNIELQATSMQFRTEKLELTVPDELKDKYADAEALKTALRTQVNKANASVSSSNIQYYDIQLQYTTDGGKTWVKATKDQFPANGITVEIPYADLKAGLDNSYTYTVIHMFTTDMKGHTVGDTESITPVKGTDGISFKVDSLSPFAIGWYKASSSGGGGGGGGGGVTTYAVEISTNLQSTIKADKTTAASGDTVTLTVTGSQTPVVTDAKGNNVALTDLGNGKYTFKMPVAKVTVTAKGGSGQTCDGGANCPSKPYGDVDTARWYHSAIDYVLTYDMMVGTSNNTFEPNTKLTRSMLVQVLYNLEGKPTGGSASFTDVAANAWYAPAVKWAASQNLVGGYGNGKFGPNDAITREQAAAILYRYAQYQKKDVSTSGSLSGFTDSAKLSGWAKNAMQWAVGTGLITGKDGGRLDPAGTATRAEIAAIFQRYCESK